MTKKKSYTVEEQRALISRAEHEFREAKKMSLLPHIYGAKPYRWTLDFWQSTNRMKLIVGGNQISKSSTLIRHAIDLATDKSKWEPEVGYFPKRRPRVFWYIYPNATKVFEEWEKWENEWLPRGPMKNDPDYGWSPIYRKSDVAGIKFNSGITLYFKTWRTDNQAGTVDWMGVDEEIPAQFYDELSRRITVYEGMYCGAFTATIGQPFWYEAMELIGKKGERFPTAWKRCISAYDCLEYADGSPSTVWNTEKIKREINKCSSDAAVKMRIYGRFASTEGLIYPSFRRERNIKPYTPVPNGWSYYGGVDIGTGGPEGHPAAISIVAVNQSYTQGRAIALWKGGKEAYTNTTDILNQYIKMTRQLNMTANYYDWHNKEFFLRASEAGVAFQKADKAQEFGRDLLNVLFKNEMLTIDDCEYADELAQEFETLRDDTAKTRARDDQIDSLRYACSKIPWDMDSITSAAIIDIGPKRVLKGDDARVAYAIDQGNKLGRDQEEETDFDSIIDEYNDLMEG